MSTDSNITPAHTDAMPKQNSKQKRGAKSAARKTGASRGRRADAGSKSSQVRELLATGMKATEIAKKVGCRLGLVYNVKARAAAKGRTRRAAKPSPKVALVPTDLGGIVAAVRASQRDTEKMRAALVRIQALIADALS
jgi:hypothetical protein